MTKNNIAIKEVLVEIFGKIMEQALRRMPPFDDVAFEISRYNYLYGNYLRLKTKIEGSFSKELNEAIIEKAKYTIRRDLAGCVDSFSVMSPVHGKTIKRFYQLIEEKHLDTLSDEAIEAIFSGKDENIKVASTVKKIFKEKLLGFQHYKKKQAAGELLFKKKLNEESNFLVIVDTGSWRSWLHFLVGIDTPEILIDINKIFLLSKTAFDFNSKDELVNILSKVAVLLNEITAIMKQKLGPWWDLGDID